MAYRILAPCRITPACSLIHPGRYPGRSTSVMIGILKASQYRIKRAAYRMNPHREHQPGPAAGCKQIRRFHRSYVQNRQPYWQPSSDGFQRNRNHPQWPGLRFEHHKEASDHRYYFPYFIRCMRWFWHTLPFPVIAGRYKGQKLLDLLKHSGSFSA